MNPKQNRPPLCKFINNCKNFKQKRECIYSHDVCMFGKKCNQQQNCKFYHPQLQGTITNNRPEQKSKEKSSNISLVPCKFGNLCNKKQSGNCPFNHDINSDVVGRPSAIKPNPSTSIPKSQTQCKFGLKCNKYSMGMCPFKHSGANPNNTNANINLHKEASMSSVNPIEPPKKSININQQRNQNYNLQFQQFERKKLCHNFAANQCLKQNCQLLHQFSTDNSIKKCYYRYFQQPQVFCRMVKMNQKTLFAFSTGPTLGFYELDQEFQVFKSVCNSQIKAQSSIIYLFTDQNDSNQLQSFKVIYITPGKINIYNPLNGVVNSQHFDGNPQMTNAFFFTQEQVLFINRISAGLIVKTGNYNRPDIINQLSKQKKQLFFRMTVFKKIEILGQKFIIIGNQQGHIGFINQKLEIKNISIPNTPIVDVCAIVYNDQPFALIVGWEQRRQFSIYSISLLDYSINALLSYQNSHIRKIQSIFGRVFVAVDKIGILIYNLPDFRRLIGRISFPGTITNMQTDRDGKLLVVEKQTVQRGSSISVYKVRK